MKRLLILRHAKAVPHGTMPDFDRILAEEGHAQMVAIAAHLASRKTQPGFALVSPAARTRETWERAGLADVPVRFVDRIYETTHEGLLELVQALPDEVECAIMVGHNPAFEDFCLFLRDAADHLRTLPTAGLVAAKWAVDHWADARFENGRVSRFVTPSSLTEPSR